MTPMSPMIPAPGDVAAEAARPRPSREGPERRCIVTRSTRPKAGLIRFVAAADGTVVPDLGNTLPGRGLWVTADRALLERAIERNMFARAARAPVVVPAGLAANVEAQLAARCLGLIGLARRSGHAVAGFSKTQAWLDAGKAGVLLAASDGAEDGKAKLARRAGDVPVIGLFDAAALGRAFGRDPVVHGALARGGLAASLVAEAARLTGIRGGGAGSPDDLKLDTRDGARRRHE